MDLRLNTTLFQIGLSYRILQAVIYSSISLRTNNTLKLESLSNNLFIWFSAETEPFHDTHSDHYQHHIYNYHIRTIFQFFNDTFIFNVAVSQYSMTSTDVLNSIPR